MQSKSSFAPFALSMLALLASTDALAAYSLAAPYQYVETGGLPHAVAIGDINGDGRNDLVLSTMVNTDDENDDKVFVYFQQANGTLAEPQKFAHVRFSATPLTLADLDRDGDMEIVLGHSEGITIYNWGTTMHAPKKIGTATPSMRSRSWGPTPIDFDFDNESVRSTGVAVLDIDRDGNLDIFATLRMNAAVVYFGDGMGGVKRIDRMNTSVGSHRDMAVADFNHDGFDDLALLLSEAGLHAAVYYNDGTVDLSPPLDLKLSDANYSQSTALEAGDFNDDGRADLIATREGNWLAVYEQNTMGGFKPQAQVEWLGSVDGFVARDLDLDGRDDLAVLGASVWFWLPQGATGGLSTSTMLANTLYMTDTPTVGDLNGDMCPDLAAVGYFGLAIHRGVGCNTVADLGVSLGLTPSVVSVRLDNYGVAAAAAPEARVTLSMTGGTLVTGVLPAECTQQTLSVRSVRVTCKGASLAAATSRTLLLPISLAGGDHRNTLNVSATVTTTSAEQALKNNGTSKSLRIGAIPAPTLARRASR